jgi:hypothetical protein
VRRSSTANHHHRIDCSLGPSWLIPAYPCHVNTPLCASMRQRDELPNHLSNQSDDKQETAQKAPPWPMVRPKNSETQVHLLSISRTPIHHALLSRRFWSISLRFFLISCVDPKPLNTILPAESSTRTFWSCCWSVSQPSAPAPVATTEQVVSIHSRGKFKLRMARGIIVTSIH